MAWHRRGKGFSDEEKIQHIYQQFATLAYYIAIDVLQDKEDAEDAVQETFIRIMKNITRIAHPFSLETKNFVAILCKNISLDMLKRRKYKKLEEIFSYTPDGSLEPDSYDLVSGNETIRVIADEIHKLPDRYKDCMYMELVLEFDYREIAAILEHKPETVRKRLQRGKKVLRKKLEEKGISYEK